MRILICSERSPAGPPSGGRLILRGLLRELAPRHIVRLICLEGVVGDGGVKGVSIRAAEGSRIHRLRPSQGARDHPGDADWWQPPGLMTRLGRLVTAVALGRPMHVDRLARRMKPSLERELQTFRPDLIQVFGGALGALGRSLEDLPSVLVSMDAEQKNVEAQAFEFTGIRRRLFLGEAQRMKRFESEDYSRFRRIVVVSERDREVLQSSNPSLVIDVIPTGVDTDLFAPPPPSSRGLTIVFHGVMNFAPNVQAAHFLARHVLPIVHQRYADARLTIVGRAPTPEVRTLARLPGVSVTGPVEDVRPWLNRGRVYVCPMFIGTGIKNKLLEAMSSGMACIATPLATGGLTARPGREFLLARDADEVARQIEVLLADDELVQKLGRAARRYIEANHGWRTVSRKFEDVYETVAYDRDLLER